jgi:hypothetical protein
MGYKVGNLPDINQPVNILEEIVWYKAKEIEAFREKQPLPMLQVRQPAGRTCRVAAVMCWYLSRGSYWASSTAVGAAVLLQGFSAGEWRLGGQQQLAGR